MLVEAFSLCLIAFVHELHSVKSDEYPAPIQFTEEPKNIQFSNKNSGYLHCAAKATSSYSNTDQIIVSWRYGDGALVQNISGTILILSNGTLWFPPFKKLNPRVHQGKFQCVAKLRLQNRAILSRTASVNGIIVRPFKVTVEDQYVVGTSGTAMFTCVYPKEVSSYVRLQRWWKNKDIAAHEPSGHLVVHVQDSERVSYFYCVVVNLLTNEIIASNIAKLFITVVSSGLPSIPFELSIAPLNQTTIVGKTVLLECLIVRKNVEYSWKHNDQDIKLDHRISLADGRSLRITNTSLADFGKYTCSVRDKSTRELKTASAYLFVRDPLEFRERPVKICTPYNLNVTFYCEINGYPPPTVTWYKDAEEITYNSKISREGNNLVITTAWGKDEGIYQCIANNGLETIHQAASLIVGAQPPTIIEPFQEKVLDQHAKLDISCKAVGDRKPTLSWYRDGKLIDETMDNRIDLKQYQDLWTLQIKNTTAADNGIYRCEAKNRAGMNFSEAEIFIRGPAQIIHISQNPVGLSGQNVKISCKAKGYPVPKITWLDESNNPLPNDYRHSVTSLNGESILTIKEAKSGDEGNYKCSAENGVGQADQAVARLDIFSAPEESRTEVTEEGKSKALICNRGQKWTKDGKSIQNDRGITVQRIGYYMIILHIPNITAADAGNYHCSETLYGDVYKKSIELVVITRPRFTNEHKPTYNVLEYKNVELLCPAAGFPTPRIEWQRKTGTSFQPIPRSPRFLATLNGSLTILNATADDATHYSCIADNLHSNKESRTTELNVNVPAKIINWMTTTSGDAGNTTQLYCRATGNQKLTFTWFRAGKEIDINERQKINRTSTSSILIIERTTIKDGGNYTCKVENVYGDSERKLILKIRDKPFPPVITKHTTSKRSITIFWKIKFDGNSAITSYKIDYKKKTKPWSLSLSIAVPRNETSFKISGLQPYKRYEIRVTAKNRMGFSNPSEVFTAGTEEDAPSEAPTFDVIPRDEGFRIHWEQLPRKSSNGLIQGYYIKYREVGSKDDFKQVTVRNNDGTEYILTDLKDYTLYEIMLRAFTKAGPGPNSNLTIERTNEGVPSKPPSNIDAKPISSTSASLSWDQPPEISWNGILIGYQIVCRESGVNDRLTKNIGLQTNFTLRGLSKYTNYVIKLAARTRKGAGKLSGGVEVRTCEDFPGSPKDLTIIVTSVTSIKVEWTQPDFPNGKIIAYKIYYVTNKEDINKSNAYSIEVKGTSTTYEFENMEENQTYYFWTCAKTNVGEGDPTEVAFASTSKGPPVFTNGPQSDEFTAKWKTDATLTCKFTGVPTPKVTWLDSFEKPLHVQTGKKYQVTDEGKLIVQNLNREDSKRYVCRVQNKLGSIKKSVILKVQAPPFPPEDINFIGINSTAVMITWKSGFNGNSIITNYSLQYRRIDTAWKIIDLIPSQTLFKINNIQSKKLYIFRMRASNEIGRGNFSEPKKRRFNGGAILSPTEDEETEEEVESTSSSKIFYKDTAVLGTLIGVCLFIVIVIVVLVLLTKLGFNPGSKIVQRSIETWRWFVAKRTSSEDRRRNRRSGGSSTDGHLGGSSSSLSQQASNNGSLFSLPRSSSRVTESGYITSFVPTAIPPPFSNYTPGSNSCESISGSSDEGIGPETRGEQQQVGRSEPNDGNSQPFIPPRSSNGTPAPLTMLTTSREYDDAELEKEEMNLDMEGASPTSNLEEEKLEELHVSPNIPMGKEKIYVQSYDDQTEFIPVSYNQHPLAVRMSPRRPKYDDGHFIIAPDVDRILAYRPPRCYDSTSSEYSSSRDELAQAYEFGKLHHLDDFYGRPTLESASSSGETASSEKDGICHFTAELTAGRPFLIPIAILPPPPNQRLRTRDRSRNNHGAPLKTYYEKDETLV